MSWYDSEDGDWHHLIEDDIIVEKEILENMAVYNYATGTINWAKILGDPVPNYNRDSYEWTFDFYPDKAALALFKELKIDNKMKEDKAGNKFLRFTQKEKQANGKANFPITVVDARNRPWDPTVKIGNETKGEVKFKVIEYGKGMPTGVYPQAVRVLEHKEYVRQEFAPLPEDNEYVQALPEDDFSAPVEIEPEYDAEGKDPLE